jgi:hypothetical protein
MVFDCNNIYDYTYEPIQLICYFVIFVYNDFKIWRPRQFNAITTLTYSN